MNITLEGEVASRQPDSIPKRETRNEKRLRNAAIAFSYRHYIAAYLAGRVHRAVPDRRSRTLLSEYTRRLTRSGCRAWLASAGIAAGERCADGMRTAIPAMRPVRNSPEMPTPIASARPSACRGTISP